MADVERPCCEECAGEGFLLLKKEQGLQWDNMRICNPCSGTGVEGGKGQATAMVKSLRAMMYKQQQQFKVGERAHRARADAAIQRGSPVAVRKPARTGISR